MSQYTVFAHLICFALFILLHILLFISLFLTYIYALVLCYFYIIFIFILLHCPLSGPDLIYISLLIIPCIIYYVTNKETLDLGPWYIYIYIYIYIYHKHTHTHTHTILRKKTKLIKTNDFAQLNFTVILFYYSLFFCGNRLPFKFQTFWKMIDH